MSEREEYTVTSEIYAENDYATRPADRDNYVLSEFPFYYNVNAKRDERQPPTVLVDDDGDLCVRRKTDYKHSIVIEYSRSTTLKLVGLQVWRGAFLLADFMLHYGTQLTADGNQNGTVLELGSGSGLSGIVAAMKFESVICTDINVGGILELINRNIERNKDHLRGDICAMELDFKATVWSQPLMDKLKTVGLIIAADVIYDNDLTDAFVETLQRLFAEPPRKTAYIALEKRYVFTTADLDTVAPCYEHFLELVRTSKPRWDISNVDTDDFPKYFEYDRCKELVLLRITRPPPPSC